MKKKLTPNQYLQLHPEQYVMVTYEFGAPIYIAPLKDLNIQVTSNKNDATKWSALDVSDIKLGFHKAITGYKGLVFEQIPFMTVEQIAKEFKATPEQVKAQYQENAKQLRKMQAKASATGKRVGNLDAAELKKVSDNFESVIKQQK